MSNKNNLGVRVQQITKTYKLKSSALTVMETEVCRSANVFAEQFQDVRSKWATERKQQVY